MKRKLLFLLTSLLTMAQGVWAWSGSGTQANPYLITSVSDWNTLATNSASNTYTDAYFKLTADITVTTMVGTEIHKFGGIFDGGGHTLTLSYGTSGSPLNSNNAAPFSYVNGVTIKNLHVAGNIYTSGQFAGSLMGDVRENNAIRNCWSSVVLTTSKSGDGTHGGFAGVIRGGTTNFTNCLFDGKLLGGGTNGCGGFVGFTRTNDGARLNFTNCLYKPSGQTIDTSSGATFSRAHDTSLLGFTNCWYTQTLGTTQGSNASGMSNEALLSNLGSSWEIKDSKVVPKMIPATFSGSGTAASPYLITSTADWNNLASNVNDLGETYSGKYFELTNDISVTTMVGASTAKFAGIFAGGGHTLTVSYGTAGSPLSYAVAAPFRYVQGATISYLHVAGNIYTSNQKAGSLIGEAYGSNTLTNCWASIIITSSNSGDGTTGGVIGLIVNGTTTFTNCLFDGKLLGSSTYNCGGFVGWTESNNNAIARFNNCFFNPSQVTMSTSGAQTFARVRSAVISLSLDNCYYKTSFGGTQGTDASSMSNSVLLNNLGSGWKTSGDKVVPVMEAYTFSGNGTEASPYLITSTDDWNKLATNVNHFGMGYSGIYFRLTNDISVTTMVGYPYRDGSSSDHNIFIPESSKPFCGIFDGYDHTLTVNYYSDDGNVKNSDMAPFRLVGGVTIRNLHTTGTITTASKFASGLIGRMTNNMNFNVTIENCVSGVTINSTISGDGTHGGFVAVTGHQDGTTKTLNIRGCLFNGTINAGSTWNCGGFVGWNENCCTVNITNCVFNPAAVTINTNGCYTFSRRRNANQVNITNSYYFRTLNEAQGKAARSISAGDGVSTLAISGDPTATYNVSGITAYSTGINYNDAYYAGNGDEVGLALTHADAAAGYTFSMYTTSGGSLANATTNSPTLTMPDANVTIGASYTENTAILTDAADLSALSAYAGKTCTVTYTRSFTAGKSSTVCLPFAFAKGTVGTFYTFTNISKSGSEYIADMTEYTESNLVANTPYLFTPSATGEVDFSGTYEIPAELVAGSTESNGWTFKGTYETISWTEAPTGIYGFSAQNVDEQGISQGQFVKVGEYVRIRPMRCYLENKSFAGARGMNRAAADEPLPETIKVRLISANGDVTGIGSMSTKTGEVTMDSEAWYSIDGRRIEGKPSTKGIYVNNGKKVVIK